MVPLALATCLRERVMLLDGGLGTLFLAQGLEQGQAPEAWNLEYPDRVVAAHKSYLEAGSDVLHTNTFGASPPKLAAAGMTGLCREINVKAVEHARRAVEGKALLAGDVGPTGLLLPPLGEATEDQVESALQEQIEALVHGGVDLISIETMFDLREALAALRATQYTGIAAVCSMTFEVRKRGVFTILGNKLSPSLESLAKAGAVAVGFNCSVTSEVMIGMVQQAHADLGDIPLVAQPNGGAPQITPTGVHYDCSAERFSHDLMEMVRHGARMVGGCCGTGPDHVRAARSALDDLSHNEGTHE